MKRVLPLETDDIRQCVCEMLEIEARQDAERVKNGVSDPVPVPVLILCTHERWEFLSCEDEYTYVGAREWCICLDCSAIWEEE